MDLCVQCSYTFAINMKVYFSTSHTKVGTKLGHLQILDRWQLSGRIAMRAARRELPMLTIRNFQGIFSDTKKIREATAPKR